MKILIVSQFVYPEVGGGPTRITNLSVGLKAKGQDVSVLTCLPNYPQGRIFDGYRGRLSMKEEYEGVKMYRYWTYATVSRSAFKRALSMTSFAIMIWLFAFKRKTIKQFDRVIIQSPTLFVATSAMMLFKGLYHKKTILNVSDLWPSSLIEMNAMKEGSFSYRIMSKCERYLYRKADAIMGQSNEILDHISTFPSSDSKFLYRHLQRYAIPYEYRERNETLKIVYAGVLNAPQDILSLIKSVDFNALGVEFHLYGGGTQQTDIEQYIAENPDCKVFYHGFVSKEQVSQELVKYDASIVPLVVRLKGAVPSKIFDILPLGIPVLFCGGGEGAEIVKKYGIGFVSAPGDYMALQNNVAKLNSLTKEEYIALSHKSIEAARDSFDFDKQLTRCIAFIESV